MTPKEQNQTTTVVPSPRTSRYLPPRDVNDKPLCYRCKKYGHISKYCSFSNSNPMQSSTSQPVCVSSTVRANENKTTIQKDTKRSENNPDVCFNTVNTDAREANLKYFQEALVNGHVVKAYLDFGSQCNLMRKSDAEKLSLQYYAVEKSITIRGFGQGKVEPLGEVEVTMEVDQATANTKVLIVPDYCQQIPLLIGQPFTEKEHIVIVRRGNILRIFEEQKISEDDCLRQFNIPDLPKPKINLWAKETSVIPADYIGFIMVYSEYKVDDDLLVEKQTEHDRNIPRCVIRLDEDNKALSLIHI